VRKSSKQVEQDKSKLQRVKELPWALLLQMGLVLGRRWRALSAKDRARLTELTRKSQGRLGSLSKKEHKEFKKLVGKLHPKRTARDLVLLTRARRRRKRR
jgi:mevalonate kinase